MLTLYILVFTLHLIYCILFIYSLIFNVCMCEANVPSLPSKPVVSAELVGSSVHLRCSFTGLSSVWPLGFQVVWARYSSNTMKVEIRRETTTRLYSLAEMDGLHFRLGETVQEITLKLVHTRTSSLVLIVRK